MRRALCCLTVVAAACGIVKFDVEQDLPAQTVQGSLVGGLLPSLLPNPTKFTIDIKSEVQKRGTGPATKAQLKSLTLAITPHDAPAGNFDFISEVHLFVETTGLPKVEIARLAPVPRGATDLTFEVVPGVDLLPYINAGASITATASGSQPSQDTSFDGHVVVEVGV